MPGKEAAVKRRTGGRSALVRTAVLAAALNELLPHGYEHEPE